MSVSSQRKPTVIQYSQYLISGIFIAMIKAVFMAPKKSTVPIKMPLTATGEQLTLTYPQKERYFILELYNLNTADKERPMLFLVLVT